MTEKEFYRKLFNTLESKWFSILLGFVVMAMVFVFLGILTIFAALMSYFFGDIGWILSLLIGALLINLILYFIYND